MIALCIFLLYITIKSCVNYIKTNKILNSLMYYFTAQAALFCATTNLSSSAPPSTPLIFEQITVQRGQCYNLSNGYFKVPTNGTYLSHITSSLHAGKYASVLISFPTTGTMLTNLFRTSAVQNGVDLTSGAFMLTLTKNDMIHLSLNVGSIRMTSSWSVFRLDNLMFPLIIFCVQLQNGLYSNTGKINFNAVNVNVGAAWNNLLDIFTASKNGTYVFSLTISPSSGSTTKVGIVVNNVDDVYQMVYLQCSCCCCSQVGYDTTSKTLVLSLNASDIVYARNYRNLYNNGYYSTSFAGFLYEPLDGRKVIWSVSLNTDLIGQYSPLPFQAVLVNIGDGWKNTTSKIIAPYAGVYQMHLTATSQPYNPVEYTLMWNDVAFASIVITSTICESVVTRSRAVMVEASAGDIFYIATTYSTKLHSATSFTGYLLSA